MERETRIFPSKAIWTQHGSGRHLPRPAARTRPLDRLSHRGGDGCSVRELPRYATLKKSGPSSVVGSLCVCVCVCAKCAKCVWVCRHVHPFRIHLKRVTERHQRGTGLKAARCSALNRPLAFCVFFIYFWEQCISFYYHLDLVNILNTELYRVFMMRWNIFELAQSPTIHPFFYVLLPDILQLCNNNVVSQRVRSH